MSQDLLNKIKQIEPYPDENFKGELLNKILSSSNKKNTFLADTFKSKFRLTLGFCLLFISICLSTIFVNPSLAKEVINSIEKCNVNILCTFRYVTSNSGRIIDYHEEYYTDGVARGYGANKLSLEEDIKFFEENLRAEVKSRTDSQVIAILPGGHSVIWDKAPNDKYTTTADGWNINISELDTYEHALFTDKIFEGAPDYDVSYIYYEQPEVLTYYNTFHYLKNYTSAIYKEGNIEVYKTPKLNKEYRFEYIHDQVVKIYNHKTNEFMTQIDFNNDLGKETYGSSQNYRIIYNYGEIIKKEGEISFIKYDDVTYKFDGSYGEYFVISHNLNDFKVFDYMGSMAKSDLKGVEYGK